MFFSGTWDAVVVPVNQLLTRPDLRRLDGFEALAYGPAQDLRAAWLAGVSDYLKEPWNPEELFLRLSGPRLNNLVWTTGGQTLTLEGQNLEGEAGRTQRLTAAEAEILKLLVQRRGLAVSRAVLGWGAHCSPGRGVDTLVGRLRIKLRALNGEGPVSVRGLGYRLP